MTGTTMLQDEPTEALLERIRTVAEAALKSENTTKPSRLAAQDLPITVKIVRTSEQLQRVCHLRSVAYGLRSPDLGEKFSVPEPADHDAGNVVFIAEDKETGSVVGSVRLHTNLFKQVPLESVAEIPDQLRGQLLAEACRLCVRKDYSNSLVSMILFKAIYLYCFANQVQFLLCVAREPLNQIYKSMGFSPLNGGDEEQWMPISYVGNLPHSLLLLDVLMAETFWRENKHPFYDFVGRTYHPDIQIFSAASSVWSRSRAEDRN
jgi:hypothetical protein